MVLTQVSDRQCLAQTAASIQGGPPGTLLLGLPTVETVSVPPIQPGWYAAFRAHCVKARLTFHQPPPTTNESTAPLVAGGRWQEGVEWEFSTTPDPPGPSPINWMKLRTRKRNSKFHFVVMSPVKYGKVGLVFPNSRNTLTSSSRWPALCLRCSWFSLASFNY